MELDDEEGDLLFRTYHMVDWTRVPQTPSQDRCVTCGGAMRRVEPFLDRNGVSYGGRVCHSCRVVFWLRQG